MPPPDDAERFGFWHPSTGWERDRRPWLLLVTTVASIALVIVGSMGPWIHAEDGPENFRVIATVHGTTTDGVFSLLFAGVALVLALLVAWRPELWVAAWGIVAMMAFATLVGVFDWVIFDPLELAATPGSMPDVVRVEWGLKVVTLASPVGLLLSILLARRLMHGDY